MMRGGLPRACQRRAVGPMPRSADGQATRAERTRARRHVRMSSQVFLAYPVDAQRQLRCRTGVSPLPWVDSGGSKFAWH